MEKNITLSQSKNGCGRASSELAGTAFRPFERLRRYYSDVLEEEVSYSRMWRLINAQLAFVAAVSQPTLRSLRERCARCGSSARSSPAAGETVSFCGSVLTARRKRRSEGQPRRTATVRGSPFLIRSAAHDKLHASSRRYVVMTDVALVIRFAVESDALYVYVRV